MRLATFNVLHGRSLVDDRVDLDRFAAAVRILDADVLALQEVDRDQPRSSRADLTTIAAEAMGAVDSRFLPALVGEPGAWSRPHGDEPSGTPAYGIALLSRVPVRTWSTVRLPALPGRVPALFRGRRRPVLVSDEPRVAVVAQLDVPGGGLAVVGTHLSFVPGWNLVQLQRLRRALRPYDRLVLMGDLNTGPRLAQGASGLRPLAVADTFPSPAPSRQLDHLLARGGVQAAGPGQVHRLELSDHCALSLDVRLGTAP